jgi:DNA helicase-2/ATP-dependent DNA helicase PcrA
LNKLLFLKISGSRNGYSFQRQEMLFEILRFDWFNIPPIEIATFTAYVADKKYGGVEPV